MADANRQMQLVTFQLSTEHYGIDIMDVREIVRIQEVRQIPNAPAYVEGIFNLRGDIIPIISLHKRFNLARAQLTEDDQLLSGFIIVELGGKQLGVIIDKVSRVVTISESQIQLPPQLMTGIGSEYIQGVTNEKSGYLIILNIQRLFNPKELQQLGRIAS